MTPNFSESWVSSPLERWSSLLLKSGLAFWLGGALLWLWQQPYALMHFVLSLKSAGWLAPVPVLLGMFVLLLFMRFSSHFLAHFVPMTIRFLEGYGPLWRNRFGRWRRASYVQLRNNARAEWRRLQIYQQNQSIDDARYHDLVRLEQQLSLYPTRDELIMPTRLGNILRAFESRPKDKYGLDMIICWHRLWLLMPEIGRQNLAAARRDLDALALSWLWSVLFLFWGFVHWLALPVALLSMWLCYRWLLNAAAHYGHFLEAVFDVYRKELYLAVGWEVPAANINEKAHGERLMQYLFHGV